METQILRYLLEIKGANFTDDHGNTLLQRIVSKPFINAQIPQMKEAIVFVMDRGINPLHENNDGEKARDIAIRSGWESILRMIR